MDIITLPVTDPSNNPVPFTFAVSASFTAGLPPGFTTGGANTPVYGPYYSLNGLSDFFGAGMLIGVPMLARFTRRSDGAIGPFLDGNGRGLTLDGTAPWIGSALSSALAPACNGQSPVSGFNVFHPEADTRSAMYTVRLSPLYTGPSLAGIYDVYAFAPVLSWDACHVVSGAYSSPNIPVTQTSSVYRSASFQIVASDVPPPDPDPEPAGCGCNWSRGATPICAPWSRPVC